MVKNPKIWFYRGSDGNDFQVACSISQTNEGRNCISQTLREVNIQPGDHCIAHKKATNQKYLKDKIRKSLTLFKKQQSQLHHDKLSANSRNEAKEGTTYQTSAGLRWKNALNHDYKNNNGRNFQFTKFSFIDFVLTDRRRLSGKRPKSVSGKSSSCRFSFLDERNANTKATEYTTFSFLPFLESLNLTVCQRNGFFSVLATIDRESSDKQLISRIVKSLPFIHQPDRVAPRSSDV